MNQNASEITPSASITVEAPHPRARALRAAGLLYYGDHTRHPVVNELALPDGRVAYQVMASDVTPMLFVEAPSVRVH